MEKKVDRLVFIFYLIAGKPLHYCGTVFHRVVKDFMVQSGDFSGINLGRN